jgi:hypothetical protein
MEPGVSYHIHKRPPPLPILSQTISPPHLILLPEEPFNIILPSMPRSSKRALSLRSPTKTLFAALPSLIRATCYTHFILLDLITRIIFDEEYRSWSSSLCRLLHTLVTSSPLDPNFFLRTLLSNTLSLCFSLNVRDQVSNVYKTRGKIIVQYIFPLLGSKLEDKRFCTEWWQDYVHIKNKNNMKAQ